MSVLLYQREGEVSSSRSYTEITINIRARRSSKPVKKQSKQEEFDQMGNSFRVEGN
jgi:hypothetical protein